MKKVISILLMFFVVFCNLAGKSNSLKSQKKEKKEKAVKEEIIMKRISEMLEDTAFIFNASDMLVRGAGSMSLGYKCDVQVKSETVISYLPFIGRANYLSTNAEDTGYDFTSTVNQFHFNKSKSGYDAVLEVKNGTDLLKYNFYITKTGNATLTIGSARRQTVSYCGSINEIEGYR